MIYMREEAYKPPGVARVVYQLTGVCKSHKPRKAIVQVACTMVMVKIKDLP